MLHSGRKYQVSGIYQTCSSFFSPGVSFEAFLNSLTASAKPLKSSGIFLPPKSKRTMKAIISHSVVPIDLNIFRHPLLVRFVVLNSFGKTLFDFFDLFESFSA